MGGGGVIVMLFGWDFAYAGMLVYRIGQIFLAHP